MWQVDIQRAYDEFERDYLERYGVGRPAPEAVLRRSSRSALNPYVATEDDAKVKFGGHLERSFMEAGAPLTVHAEAPVYGPGRHGRADLSVHRVAPGEWLGHNDDLRAGLVAVVEVKYANVKVPDYDFRRGAVEADLVKLASLPVGVERWLMVVDEGRRVSLGAAEATVGRALELGVGVLSNNPRFRAAVPRG